MTMQTALFWFRRDLRTEDNVGLYEASEWADRLLTVFLVDPTHADWSHHCGDRLQFKLQCLDSLRTTIRSNGGDVIVRHQRPTAVIPDLCDTESVDRVVWNRAYEPYERERDNDVRKTLEPDVQVETFKDQVIFEQDEILTNAGDPYKVFTHYAKKWKTRSKPEVRPAVNDFSAPETVDPGTIPSLTQIGLDSHLDTHAWKPNRHAALDRWNTFLNQDIATYETDRNHPSRSGTSRLSPYLRFGLVSPRELLSDCRNQAKQSTQDGVSSIDTFVEELIWRDFYQQILYNFPSVVDNNFKTKYDNIPWNTNREWLEAWKEGQTGYPIVDAAMRQLNQTGWMHNRLRMIVASFLTKDCLIHWQYGEKYFMNRLLDGDTGSNNGGWQWAASTGTDAAPYFRIFNPVTQSKKYDPSGKFIRRYCPELSALDDESIHAPFEVDSSRLNEANIRLGDDYPEPILDHSRRRDIALDAFKSVTD
jgi:deoxyribodipyrimidine photo-lyase